MIMVIDYTLEEIKGLAEEIQTANPQRFWEVKYQYQDRSHTKVLSELFITRIEAVTFIACIRSSCESMELLRR